jgi:ATP-dependent DNA helicase RecG
MDEQQLRAIIAGGESDRVEFTTSLDDTDKFSEAICAFANDLPRHQQPGYLLLGVDDAGAISGATIDDRTLLRLAGLRDSGNIQPLPSMTVEKVGTADGDVAVVTVNPATQPPVRYKSRIWVRIGPRRGTAVDNDERVLTERRVSQALTFDAQPCLDSGLDDLALGTFRNDYLPQAVDQEVIDQNHRPVEQQLASLRFYDLRRRCPTNAGIVLFGKDVRHWLSGDYLQFLRVNGRSLDAEIVNDRELYGDLLTMLRELDALIDANLTQSPVPVSTLRERMVESFPRVAVRELLMNAVMHRDYASTSPIRMTWFQDRIEIQSPGGLYGEATEANFPQQTSYRNPVIAEAMKALGYVNRYGRGVISAQEALRANGSPPATFTFDAGFVLATIKGRL